jgi:Outer membrane protein beta-barrel domain
MHRLARTVSILVVVGLTRAQPVDSQTLSVAVASGPVFLPGSGASADWQGLLWVGYQMGQHVAVRLEAMYTGVPVSDLVAFTGNLVWTFRRRQVNAVEPYLVAGLGDYVKFSEERFGLNGGAGVRRRVGPVRLFAEVRYHRVMHRFDEGSNADTFVPVSFGITLGR